MAQKGGWGQTRESGKSVPHMHQGEGYQVSRTSETSSMGNCLVWGGDTRSLGMGCEDFEVFAVFFDWVCLGCRLHSISHIPGAGHLTVYRTFSDRDGNGLWIRWGSSLNTAPMHNAVPSKSQAFQHHRGPHLTCLRYGRTAGCSTHLNSCSLYKGHLGFLFTQPQ